MSVAVLAVYYSGEQRITLEFLVFVPEVLVFLLYQKKEFLPWLRNVYWLCDLKVNWFLVIFARFLIRFLFLKAGSVQFFSAVR